MNFRYILILLALITGVVYSSGGTVYSRAGTGDLNNGYSARRLGIGGAGLALAEGTNLSDINPALWSGISITRLEAGINYRGITIEDNSGSAYYSDYDFSGFMVGFPLSQKYGISLIAGLVPISQVGYKVEGNEEALGQVSRVKYYGSGSISKIFFGSSWTLPFGFSVGASFQYYTGKISYTSEVRFFSSDMQNTIFRKSVSHHGNGFSFGILSSNLGEYLNEETITDLRIGSSIEVVNTLDTDTSVISSTSVGTITVSEGLTETKLPFKFGIGTSATLSKKYTIIADYLYQPWSEYEINGHSEPGLRDFTRMSIGFEFYDNKRRFSSFWEQIRYRCGLSYEQSQYQPTAEGINKFSLHGGISFPLGNSSTIDLGLQYGMRGKTENNLLKENIFDAFITFSFGELWFVRQER